jgi:hypothetical protein
MDHWQNQLYFGDNLGILRSGPFPWAAWTWCIWTRLSSRRLGYLTGILLIPGAIMPGKDL